MNYLELKSEEVLQKNDEYSAHNQAWKSIPDFMIGSKVPDCTSTHWRRPIVSNSNRRTVVETKVEKKSFWKSLYNAFKK